MSRDQIAAATYEAGRQFNLMKGEFGVLDADQVTATDKRINEAIKLMAEIDKIVQTVHSPEERQLQFKLLKQRVDNANLGTVCDKRELEAAFSGSKINFFNAAGIVINDWTKDISKKVIDYLYN